MANQIFIMPIIGSGSRFNPTRPKYSMPAGSSQVRDGNALVTIVVTSAEYAPTFQTFGDVFAFPPTAELDQEVTSEFEDDINDFMGDFDFGIPPRGDESSYRVLMRRLAHWFLTAQRMQANGGFNLEAYPLTTRLDSIPFVEFGSFISSLKDLNVNTDLIDQSMTFQEAFYAVCEQFDDREVAGLEQGVYGGA